MYIARTDKTDKYRLVSLHIAIDGNPVNDSNSRTQNSLWVSH